MPRPSASGRLPLVVSSAIAVVITRVTPTMLPPTIITVPTSEIARPNAVSMIVSRPKRSCTSISSALVSGPAPSERSWSPPSCIASTTSRRASAAINGMTSRVCATTIALGVNRMPKAPSGPERDSSR